MINFVKIIKKNDQTFYNYVSGTPLSRTIRVIIKLTIAIILTAFFGKFGEGLLNITLTIFSILLGFSFSIVFYLTTMDNTLPKTSFVSMELEVIVEKIRKLSKELFYNVSYFNLVAIFLILIALISLIVSSNNLELIKFKEFFYNEELKSLYLKYWVPLKPFVAGIYSFIFYIVLIECLFSFFRIISRVSYFFEQKIKVNEKIEKLEKENSNNN